MLEVVYLYLAVGILHFFAAITNGDHVTITGPSYIVDGTDSVTYNCTSNRAWAVQWGFLREHLGFIPLSNNSHSLISAADVPKYLTIVNPGPEDEKTYRCRERDNPADSEQIELVIVGRISIAGERKIEEGNDVTLTCSIMDKEDLQWGYMEQHLGFVPISNTSKFTITGSGSSGRSLTVHNIRPDDHTRYNCRQTSKPYHRILTDVQVIGAIALSGETSVVSGSDVTLYCNITMNNNELEWAFSSNDSHTTYQTVVNNPRYNVTASPTSGGFMTVLSIVQIEQSGHYRCREVNDQSHFKSHHLTVSVNKVQANVSTLSPEDATESTTVVITDDKTDVTTIIYTSSSQLPIHSTSRDQQVATLTDIPTDRLGKTSPDISTDRLGTTSPDISTDRLGRLTTTPTYITIYRPKTLTTASPDIPTDRPKTLTTGYPDIHTDRLGTLTTGSPDISTDRLGTLTTSSTDSPPADDKSITVVAPENQDERLYIFIPVAVGLLVLLLLISVFAYKRHKRRNNATYNMDTTTTDHTGNSNGNV